MRMGYSLLLREYVTAAEMDYADCAEFQITCPACHEAVFKVGRYEGDRQYLSHYAASKSNISDCELRVASIAQEHANRENLIGRGQTLDQFFGRFQEAVATWLFSGETPDWLGAADPATMRKQIAWSISRTHFVRFADHLRNFARPENRTVSEEERWEIIRNDLRPFRSDFWLRRQQQFARDFLEHLQAPNSSSAWAFMLCASLHLVLIKGNSLRDQILYSKDKQLRRILSGLDQDISPYNDDRSMLHTVAALSHAQLLMILLLLPYFDILAGKLDTRNRDVLFRWRESEMRRSRETR